MNFQPMDVLAFIVAIGLLVTFHELGHYWVMRWCGVRVLRFAFGFGRTLYARRDRHGTEWAICLWPLGGYVKPLDTREETGLSRAEMAMAFDTQSVGKRIAMVVAGPIANFVLAIFLYWLVFLNGTYEWRPLLAEPLAESPAAAAGIKAGDLLTRVDGDEVTTWSEAQWRLLQAFSDAREVSIAVAATSDGQVAAPDRGLLLALPEDVSVGPELWPALGLRLAAPELPPVIGVVQPGSAAAAAGLQPGDRIVSIDGQPVTHWADFVTAIRAHPEQTMQLVVARDSGTQNLSLTPQRVNERNPDGAALVVGKAGVGPDEVALDKYRIRQSRGPLEALQAASAETWDKSRFTLVMLGQMVVGKASLDNLSGPVTIAAVAGQTVRIGWEAFVRFLAVVSLSLGVLNLLPLPLLDGGHLMYYCAEILTGKPVSAERQATLQRFGVVLLGLLMCIALFNDLQRLFNW